MIHRSPAKNRQTGKFYDALDLHRRQDHEDSWWLNEYWNTGQMAAYYDLRWAVIQKKRIREEQREDRQIEEAIRQTEVANRKQQLKNDAVEAKRVSALNQKEWQKNAEKAAKRGGKWQREEIRALRADLLKRKLPRPHHPTVSWADRYMSARAALKKCREAGKGGPSSSSQRLQKLVRNSSHGENSRDWRRIQGKREREINGTIDRVETADETENHPITRR